MGAIKPTPIQARALRAMNREFKKEHERPQLHLYKNRKSGEIIEVRNIQLKEQKVRVSTAKVLLRNRWIEKREPDWNDYILSNKGKVVLGTLAESDYISKTSSSAVWTSEDIVDALNEKYRKLSEGGYRGAPKWVYFSELPNYRYPSRRVDFWAMCCWGSKNYKRVSYEIKTNYQDFLKEVKNPIKREFAMEISNQFFFIAPPNLIGRDEIPAGCGLIELSPSGKMITKKKAQIRNPKFEFTWDFIACLGRKVYKEIQKELEK